MLERRKT